MKDWLTWTYKYSLDPGVYVLHGPKLLSMKNLNVSPEQLEPLSAPAETNGGFAAEIRAWYCVPPVIAMRNHC